MVSNSYAFMLWNRTPWHFKSKSFGKWYAYAVNNMILCETWTDQTTCRKMENHRRERFVLVHGFFSSSYKIQLNNCMQNDDENINTIRFVWNWSALWFRTFLEIYSVFEVLSRFSLAIVLRKLWSFFEHFQ